MDSQELIGRFGEKIGISLSLEDGACAFEADGSLITINDLPEVGAIALSGDLGEPPRSASKRSTGRSSKRTTSSAKPRGPRSRSIRTPAVSRFASPCPPRSSTKTRSSERWSAS